MERCRLTITVDACQRGLAFMTISSKDGEFERGLDLFNRAHFFDAHEVLEDVWRALPRDQPSRRRFRLHMQGLIQLAVAFHHESTGNHVGARSVLERALRNLKGAEISFSNLDFDRLRAELADWQEHFAGATPRPKPPQIAMRGGTR
jgi:predicted metal-dependent hydrolase